MRYLGALLAIISALLMIAIVAVFSFLPKEPAPQALLSQPAAAAMDPVSESIEIKPVTAPVLVDTSQVEANLAQREAIYQGQITQLDQVLQERQATYLSQMETLTAQLTAAQNQLATLETHQERLLAQVAELERVRADRLAAYQTQLSQAQEQYAARFAETEALLVETQTKLAEVHAQLGR